MPRAACSRKTTRTPHECTYILIWIRSLVGTYVLGLLLCAGVIALRGAVLCCARGSDTHGQRTRTDILRLLLLYTGTAQPPPPREKNINNLIISTFRMLLVRLSKL